MFYREAGQIKTSYAADMAIFPLKEDRALILDNSRPCLFRGSVLAQ